MKWFCKLAGCLVFAAALAGCGIQDGTYSAVCESPDSLGYQAFLNITVANGVITGAEFDAVMANGQRKSADEAYTKLMLPATGVSPGEISAHYQNLLLGAKSYRQVEVDAISGATVSSGEFSRLWAALEQPLKKGEVHEVVVPPAPEFAPSTSDE